MRGRYLCHIVIAATLLFFAAALPIHAEMQTIQKSAPATKPVTSPVPAQTTPKRAVPQKTVPQVKQPAPTKKAIVDSVSLQEKGKGPVRVKDTIRLEQGKTVTLTVTGKNLDLVNKIDVAGGKREGVAVKVISSSPTTKKFSLTAKKGGTYQVKLRAGSNVIKTVSVKIDAREKVYRTAKKPAVPVPSTKPEVKKTPVKKAKPVPVQKPPAAEQAPKKVAKPAPAKKAPDQKKKTKVATKPKPLPEAKRKPAPTSQPAKPAKGKEIAASAKKPAKTAAKKPSGDKVLKRAEKTVPAPPKKRPAAGPPPKKVAVTKPVAKPAKPKGKSDVAKKPGKGSVAIDTVPLPERKDPRKKPGKKIAKSTPGTDKGPTTQSMTVKPPPGPAPKKEKPAPTVAKAPEKTTVSSPTAAGKTGQAGTIFVGRISRNPQTGKGMSAIIIVNGRNLKRVTSARIIGKNQLPKNAAILSANDREIKLRAPSDMQEGTYQVQLYAGNDPVQVAQHISTFQVKAPTPPAAPPPPAPMPMPNTESQLAKHLHEKSLQSAKGIEDTANKQEEIIEKQKRLRDIQEELEEKLKAERNKATSKEAVSSSVSASSVTDSPQGQTQLLKTDQMSEPSIVKKTSTSQTASQSTIKTQEVLSSGTSASKTLEKTTGDISKAESALARMEQMEEIGGKLGVGKELEEPEGGGFSTKGLKTDSDLLDIAQKGSITARPGGEDIPSTDSLFSPDTGGGGSERSSSLDFSSESIESSGARVDSRVASTGSLDDGTKKARDAAAGKDDSVHSSDTSSDSASDNASSSSDSSSSSSDSSSSSSSETTTVTSSDTDDSSSDGSSETSSTVTTEGSDGSSSTHTVTQITDKDGNTTTEQYASSTDKDGNTTWDYSCNGNLCNPDPEKAECVSKGCEEFMQWVYAMGLVRNPDILNPQSTLADPGGEEFGTTTRRGLKVIDSQKVMQEKLNPYINPAPDSSSGDSDIASPSTGHSVPQTDLVDTLPDPDAPGAGTGRMGPEPLPGQ